MSENQALPLSDQAESKNLSEENEEIEEMEASDDEADEYFENSKSLKVDGVFNNQGSTFPARYWYTRWSNDVAHLSRMGKALTSVYSIKKLSDDKNAKELAELWCMQTPMAFDIENFLKKHPVDNTWYFVAILANIEITERAKAKAVRVRNARSGGKAKHNPLDEFKPMIFERWLKWQENRALFKNDVEFADEMHYESDDVVSVGSIKRWCGQWKKARLLQIKNAPA
jgi:hypothetical protein